MPATPIDPRLAHLAGVAAHPRHNLTPTFSPAVAAAVMNYNNTLAAAAYAQAAQQQLFMQVAAAGATPTTMASMGVAPMQIDSTPSIPSSNGRSSVSRQSSGNVSSPPPSAAATPTPRPFSPWGLQYRGEPKAVTPQSKPSELQPTPLRSESEGKHLKLTLGGVVSTNFYKPIASRGALYFVRAHPLSSEIFHVFSLMINCDDSNMALISLGFKQLFSSSLF